MDLYELIADLDQRDMEDPEVVDPIDYDGEPVFWDVFG